MRPATSRSRVPYRCVTVDAAMALLQRSNALILDTRDVDSFHASHLDGARRVAISNLSAIIDNTERSRPVLIYCYHGYSSREYAQVFSDFGFVDVYSIDGGYEAIAARASSRTRPSAPVEKWLSRHGFASDDVNGAVKNHTTPLMKATLDGDEAVVRLLIQAGARVDTLNADGNNALWFACVGNHLALIDVLVEAGIDIDHRNDNGATPLMYAASAGKAAAVERLLAAGADTGAETLDGFSALDLASTEQCLAMLRRATGAVRRRVMEQAW